MRRRAYFRTGRDRTATGRGGAPRALQALLCGLTLAGAAALGACSSSIADLPSPIGLPANAPARPAQAPLYPAVHDMPPERDSKPMTETEVQQAERDLAAMRERQERLTGRRPGPAARNSGTPADR